MSQPFRSTNFLPRLQINGRFTHCIHRSFYLCVYFFRFVSRLQRLIRIIFVSYIWKMRSVLPNQCLLVPWLCVTCISHIDCSAYFFTFFLFPSLINVRWSKVNMLLFVMFLFSYRFRYYCACGYYEFCASKRLG